MHPQTEDYWGNVNPIGPRSCYDEGKRCAETLFFDYRRQHRLRIKVARIFNTYGPRMHPNDGRVVSNFIVQALKGEPITIYGDGKQTRSFCYVDDLIDGARAADGDARRRYRTDQSRQPGRVHHRPAGPSESSRWRFALDHQYQPLPTNDPRQRQPDISLAVATIGWKPLVELDHGLALTIAYFDELLAGRER